MMNEPKLNILFPVLNEKLRLERGIDKCVKYLRKLSSTEGTVLEPGTYRLTIVDNGSDDETPRIGRMLEEKYEEVEYIRIEERGVGIAFKTGVAHSNARIIGYMDIDLSTDLKYLEYTIRMFDEKPYVKYVNASRFHKDSKISGRKWYRKITSAGLLVLLKIIFRMRCTDAICGFTFMRKDVADRLIGRCSDEKGWFFMIELLLRAEREGIGIIDMPVEWKEDYDTTVSIKKTIRNYIVNIVRLKKTFIKEKRGR